LTTHYMEEADMLCDRVGIIDKGKIIMLDTPSKLKELVGGHIIKLKINDNNNNNNNNNNIIEILKNFTFIHKIENKAGDVIILSVNDISHDLPIILRNIDGVESVEFTTPTLTDVFLRSTGQQNIEEEAEGGFMERYARYD
jgi:ABC-2 type transport system ATP-binding protein